MNVVDVAGGDPSAVEREAAEALGVSLATLKRDWNFAKAWLRDQLTTGAGS